VEKELQVTPQEIQKSLYNNLTVKQAKQKIDALDDTEALLLLRRITDLLIPIEGATGEGELMNPLHEAMAAFDDKELGLLVQHIASRPQFKSRKKSAKTETVVEIPCAL
jgi:hypothetical protein